MSITSRRGRLALALSAAALLAGTAQAQTGRAPLTASASADPAAAAGALAPRERGDLTRQLVRKWGHHVQRVYGVRVGTWAQRMVPNFVAADSANFRKALARDTFEGAMAELAGTGDRLPDAMVIQRLANAAMKQGGKLSSADAKAIGSLNADLVYTPLQPCRIVDTRTSGGTIAANSSRSFKAVNSANFTSQGGSATDCGTLGLAASAVALNVVAVTPSSGGFATVYPFGTSLPTASSINYSAGAVVNTAIISAIPNPLQSSDFTIFTFAQAHYVVDIVGYFAPPAATALECTGTFVSQTVTAAAPTFDIAIPACPSGYTLMGAGCRTPGFNDADWAINGLSRVSAGSALTAFCSGVNKTTGSITVQGTANCCRIPGR